MKATDNPKPQSAASLIGHDSECTVFQCAQVSTFLAESLLSVSGEGSEFTKEARQGASLIADAVAAALNYEVERMGVQHAES